MTSYAYCIVCGTDLSDTGLVTFCNPCSLRMHKINEAACALHSRFPDMAVDWYDVAEEVLVAAGVMAERETEVPHG